VNRGAWTKCDDSKVESHYPEIDTHHAVMNRTKDDTATAAD